jgi:uracil-DNA glycosylase
VGKSGTVLQGQSFQRTVPKGFPSLQKKIVACQKCPRLVKYLSEIRRKFPAYWCKPVPAFGSVNSEILLLGLAPGRYGSNRTGRMFTGDASGNFLFPVLYESGFASKLETVDRDDGLKLHNCLITAVARCAPPQNKPTPKELSNCRPYWQSEIKLMKNLKVVIALGKMAHDDYLCFQLNREGGRMKDFPFRHGAAYEFKSGPRYLIDTYHPSRQNTNTGVLTKPMFLKIFHHANQLLH